MKIFIGGTTFIGPVVVRQLANAASSVSLSPGTYFSKSSCIRKPHFGRFLRVALCANRHSLINYRSEFEQLAPMLC